MSIDLLFNMEKSGTVNAVRTLVQYESQFQLFSFLCSLFQGERLYSGWGNLLKTIAADSL